MHKILIIRSDEDIAYSKELIKGLKSLVHSKEAVLFSLDTVPIGNNPEETFLLYCKEATHTLTLISLNTDLSVIDLLDRLQSENIYGIGIYISFVDDAFKEEFRKRLDGIVPTNPITHYEDKAMAMADIINYIKIWLKP